MYLELDWNIVTMFLGESGLELLEKNVVEEGIRGILGSIIQDFGNLMTPFDRARRVVLGT